MRTMVKLQDLVDLAKPPWRNMAEASTSGRSKEDAMDLEAEVANREEDVAEPPPSLGKQIWVWAKPVLYLFFELCFHDVFVV